MCITIHKLLVFHCAVPDAVTDLTPSSMRNTSDVVEVLVSLSWLPPSPRNGPYNLELSYTAEQAPPYPAERKLTDSATETLTQNTSQFTIQRALPYALYNVTVRAINIKLGLLGMADGDIFRSEPTGE